MPAGVESAYESLRGFFAPTAKSGRAEISIAQQKGYYPTMSKQHLVWKEKPEAEDYAGALNYLALICSDTQSKKIVRVLRKAKTIERAAKDLLRAADLRLLSRDDPHVDEDLKKIHKGKPLPPVLLVRGEMNKGAPLIVADGYHRICAVCYYDENAPIPCRMAE